MANKEATFSAELDYAFTPSDTDDDPEGVGRAIHCNVGGSVELLLDGSTIARTYVLVTGGCYPYRVRRVNATNLNATIHGLK